MKLIGWHGDKQAWCRGLMFASPAPFLKILVRSEARRTLAQGHSRAQPSSKPCKQNGRKPVAFVPLLLADVRSAFLVMSGGLLGSADVDSLHCLRDGVS